MTTQTTPTPESVKALADGLTKAQRELLLSDGGSVRAYKPAVALIAKGLWHDTPDEYRVPGHRTPLGILVRAHIGASHA